MRHVRTKWRYLLSYLVDIMGNSNSARQRITGASDTHSWAHSFPRSTSSSFKVLPDKLPPQQKTLRHTDNGAILQNGGTISGRKVYATFEPQMQQKFGNRTEADGWQDPIGYRRGTMYGSEPDLRYLPGMEETHARSAVSLARTKSQCYYTNNNNSNNDSSAKARIVRTRKKYKAPPAPIAVTTNDSSSPDSYHPWDTSGDSSEVTAPTRKSRLYKTRAESKRHYVENGVMPQKQIPLLEQDEPRKYRVPGQLQRSASSPQFQEELAAKLQQRAVREPPVGKAADSPHSSPLLKSRNHVTYLDKNISKSYQEIGFSGKPPVGMTAEKKNEYRTTSKCVNGIRQENSKSSRANRHKNVSQIEKNFSQVPNKKPAAPVKKYYFGMEAESNAQINDVEHFVPTVPKNDKLGSISHSSSYSSGQATMDETPGGISPKLRPTLPRKQLDIPRFSPTAAWRLLSALESPIHSEEDDLLILEEEQIPHPNSGVQVKDRYGDSGISGDTSPHNHSTAHNSQMTWTPQQDLEETSSDGGLELSPVSDGGLELSPVSQSSVGTAKFSPRFSLSLPREENLVFNSFQDKHPSAASIGLQNLKKLKRSVSGALGKSKNVSVSSLDENWLLSRSVPNLHDGSRRYLYRSSDTSHSSPDQDEELTSSLTKPASFSYLANGGHIMYLPEYKSLNTHHSSQPNRHRHHRHCNGNARVSSRESSRISRSCENLTQQKTNVPARENNLRSKSGKKFTFQSTIRQIERRRIAEKLSKEAEQKEKQRLRELEAMRKVEEEFQRKREKEKADIRQQLRVYNLTAECAREQPDGAVLPPPPTTQILSEFREPRRDYRDYPPVRSELRSSRGSDIAMKKETVHPEVIFRMPKSSAVYVAPRFNSNPGSHHSGRDSVSSTPKSSCSDNYRKDFAHGALPRSVPSSDSEASQQFNLTPDTRVKSRSRF